ncbi:hypothetical protein ES708_22709 [subsurface metagenome]
MMRGMHNAHGHVYRKKDDLKNGSEDEGRHMKM